MRNFAFIFARGGSKGLPGKNIRSLLGKPLIQYSIETALACNQIEKVFVSTDDLAISKIALNNGAVVIERPHELATDTSPEWLSWRHAIDWAKQEYGSFDGFISLPATSPLRSVDDVNEAISKLTSVDADVCISVTPASRSPYFNMVKCVNNGLVELIAESESNVSRRQDAPEVFDITTVVYATTPEFVLNNDKLFSGKVTSVVIPKNRAIDIDDIYDFRLAEVILQGDDL